MTYNIFEGGASYGGRLDAILRIITQSQPDLLALNECNGFADDGMRTVYRLERELGMRGILLETRTGFHLAVFLKEFEIVAAHAAVDWFHHGALRLNLVRAGKPLTMIATHLCPFSSESRVREAQYLASYVRDQGVIVLGDMNSISPHDVARLNLSNMLPYRRSRHFVPGSEIVDTRAMAVFHTAGLIDLWHQAHVGEAGGGTLPTPLVDGSAKPALRVDYILATPALARGLTRCDVLIDDATRAVSDHYPVIADLDF